MYADADSRGPTGGDPPERGPVSPPPAAVEEAADDASSPAWGNRSLSVGGGAAFFLGACLLFGGAIVAFGWLFGDTAQELQDATAEQSTDRQQGSVAGSSPEGTGAREEGIGFGGPQVRTLYEIALDELEGLQARARKNDNGQYVELELRENIYDDDLKNVARLPALQILHVHDAQVSGEGCRALVRLKRLTELDLQGSPITDRGLQQVARLVHLRLLDLRDTRVTVNGLLSLTALPHLKTLVLSPGQLSKRRIKGRLPGCTIVWQMRGE